MTTPSFWHNTDTPSRFIRVCTCKRSGDQHDFTCHYRTEWEKERGGCLARSGNGNRCNELVGREFPFCDRFHREQALTAFAEYLAYASRLNPRYSGLPENVRATVTFIDRALLCPLDDAEMKKLGRHLGIHAPVIEKPDRSLRVVRRCSLYRHYDDEGLLLYVGISVDPAVRMKQHESSSPWWRFVAESDIDWYLTETDAAQAERRAIIDEAPIFNKAGATPERDPRAIRYLVDHEALDLLRAAA